jgi:hypothetical protein
MKIENTISKILTNKIVLYIVFIISALNLIGYLYSGNTNAVVYFIILGVLVSYFSKNMIIILLVPLIFVNLYVGSQSQLKNVEGMVNNENQEKQEGQENPKEEEKQPVENTAGTSEPSNPLMDSLTTTSSSSSMSTPSGESFKNKKDKHKLDYSATLSETYDHLNQMLGSEGMKSLTSDTKKLMEQQTALAESMKGIQPLITSIGPLLKQAQGFLGDMNKADGAGKGLEGLSDMMKKFTDGGGVPGLQK